MKSKFVKSFIAIAPLVALALPGQLAAQHHHYKVIDLGTFGGQNSSVGTSPLLQILNNQGVVVGVADTSVSSPNCVNGFSIDCMQTYGFKWQDGTLTKLKPLPGGSNSGAFCVNDLGVVLGSSDNGSLDPISGIPATLSVLYFPGGGITPLGTLGGSSSIGNAVNDPGQAVGCALTGESDPFFGVVQHAVIWQNGIAHDLKTLGGPDSCAFFINNRAQVAGDSLTNSVVNATTGFPTSDPFLWENGVMKDLGSLGGVFGGAVGLNSGGQVAGNSDLEGDRDELGFLWDNGVLTPIPPLGGTFSIAISLNDAGAVVGFGAYPGDQNGDAFVWKNGVLTDLGRFGNDPCSVAQNINSPGQIVGVSTDCFETERAVLWENGQPIADLNALIPPNSGLYLHEADFINGRGEITGTAILPNGDQHVFLLVPCDENHPAIAGCDYGLVDVADVRPTQAPAELSTPAPEAKLSPAELIARFRSSMANRYLKFRPLPRQ